MLGPSTSAPCLLRALTVDALKPHWASTLALVLREHDKNPVGHVVPPRIERSISKGMGCGRTDRRGVFAAHHDGEDDPRERLFGTGDCCSHEPPKMEVPTCRCAFPTALVYTFICCVVECVRFPKTKQLSRPITEPVEVSTQAHTTTTDTITATSGHLACHRGVFPDRQRRGSANHSSRPGALRWAMKRANPSSAGDDAAVVRAFVEAGSAWYRAHASFGEGVEFKAPFSLIAQSNRHLYTYLHAIMKTDMSPF